MAERSQIAVGYARVSKASERDYSLSLSSQEAKIRQLCDLHDLDLVDVLRDHGASGRDLNREGAEQLLAMIDRREVDAVVIYKLDRLTRNVRDLGCLVDLLNARDVRLVSVVESIDTSTPAGRMIANMLVSVGQWEREEIGARTRAALAHKKERGERTGNIAYGYRLLPSTNGGPDMVEEDPFEQSVISEILRLRRDAGLPFSRISERINHECGPTRSGSPWTTQRVWSVWNRYLGTKRTGRLAAVPLFRPRNKITGRFVERTVDNLKGADDE